VTRSAGAEESTSAEADTAQAGTAPASTAPAPAGAVGVPGDATVLWGVEAMSHDTGVFADLYHYM